MINPTIATIIVLVIIVVAILVVALDGLKFRKNIRRNQKQEVMSQEVTKQSVLNITKVFKTFNMNTIQSLTSEMMYYMTECTCKIFQKVGVKKIVNIEIKESTGAAPNIVVEDGKNDGSVSGVHGRYEEKYLDLITDKVLYQKTILDASIVCSTIISSSDELVEAKFCTQCGAPLENSGSFYHCNYCGFHCSTEAFKWTITGLSVNDVKKEDKQGIIIMVGVCGILLLSLIATLFDNGFLSLIVYVLDIFALVACLAFCQFVMKNLKGIKDCKKYDPNFSRDEYKKRVEYLYRLYNLSKDLDITKIQSFMDENFYQSLLQKHDGYDDFYYLDNQFIKMYSPNFEVKNGKQYLTNQLIVDEVSINNKKKIRKKKHKVNLVLVRDATCKTDIKNNGNEIVCDNCHASLNLAVTGICQYCGSKVDIMKHDWCLHSIEG